MKIRFLKDHGFNKAGSETEAADGAANYLIRVKVAEEVKEETPEELVNRWEKERDQEKAEIEPAKEKAENKTGNVPTARKKKKK